MSNPPNSIPLSKSVNTFARTILDKMIDYRKNNHLTDVIFRVGEKRKLVFAHRLVLCVTSPYFRELFMHKPYTTRSEVVVKDVDPDIFETLIESCYTGVIVPRDTSVRPLLVAAMVLQLEDAIKVCSKFIVDKLNLSNFSQTDTFANEVNCDCLKTAVINYASQNFEQLCKSPEFLQFHPEMVQQIIENPELNIKSEEDVFHAVVLWYRHDEPTRSRHLATLLGSLRLVELAPAFILKNVQLLPGCEQLALDALHWFHVPEARNTSTLRYTKARSTNTTLIAIQITGNKNTILRYNSNSSKWQQCGEVKMRRWFFKVLYMNSCLIFVGGVSNNQLQLTNCVVNYSMETQKLEKYLPMRINRRGFCVAMLRCDIYAIGGYDSSKNCPLKYVERFDSRLQRWLPVASLLLPRCFASAVVYADQIYVTGGITTDDVCINAVECYDPQLNIWDCRSDMLHERSLHGLAVLRGHIFAIGGVNDNGYIESVERFDPQQNIWKEMCPMQAARQQVCAVTYLDKIFALGGWNDQALSTVEIYDPNGNMWSDGAALPEPAQYNSVVVPTFLIDKMEENWIHAHRCSENFMKRQP